VKAGLRRTSSESRAEASGAAPASRAPPRLERHGAVGWQRRAAGAGRRTAATGSGTARGTAAGLAAEPDGERLGEPEVRGAAWLGARTVSGTPSGTSNRSMPWPSPQGDVSSGSAMADTRDVRERSSSAITNGPRGPAGRRERLAVAAPVGTETRETVAAERPIDRPSRATKTIRVRLAPPAHELDGAQTPPSVADHGRAPQANVTSATRAGRPAPTRWPPRSAIRPRDRGATRAALCAGRGLGPRVRSRGLLRLWKA